MDSRDPLWTLFAVWIWQCQHLPRVVGVFHEAVEIEGLQRAGENVAGLSVVQVLGKHLVLELAELHVCIKIREGAPVDLVVSLYFLLVRLDHGVGSTIGQGPEEIFLDVHHETDIASLFGPCIFLARIHEPLRKLTPLQELLLLVAVEELVDAPIRFVHLDDGPHGRVLHPQQEGNLAGGHLVLNVEMHHVETLIIRKTLVNLALGNATAGLLHYPPRVVAYARINLLLFCVFASFLNLR